jgi:MerR family transcriptional regulator, redox-sensitive transcriptional activator SoxR
LHNAENRVRILRLDTGNPTPWHPKPLIIGRNYATSGRYGAANFNAIHAQKSEAPDHAVSPAHMPVSDERKRERKTSTKLQVKHYSAKALFPGAAPMKKSIQIAIESGTLLPRDLALAQAGLPSMLSVGELARRSGVAVSTLHFYERRGMIRSVRTAGNQRRYAREVLRRVALIRVAQRVGISLTDIDKALASLPPDAIPTRADWQRLSEDWRADLDDRIAQLKRLRDTLDDCIGCGCLSIEKCRLRNPKDRLGEHASGPQRLLTPRARGE